MEGLMLRKSLALLLPAAMLVALAPQMTAQSQSYRLVPGWAKLPAGKYFGMKNGTGPSPKTTRTDKARQANMTPAQIEAERRAAGRGPTPLPFESTGISGLAIDAQDRVYAFNRGLKPIMVFDRDGNLVMEGGDLVHDGKRMDPSHSGAVDWDGNVYVSDIENARVLKFSPKLDKVLLQIGTTGVPGTDGTHLNRPSGIAVLHSGNIIITDGYGNNRVGMWDKTGKFIKQVAKGAGGPQDKGNGKGEWTLPHKLAVDADETLYIVDRENYRIQVFDKNLNYIREITQPDWNPWDIAISRKGSNGVAYIADHTSETLQKISLKDGTVLAKMGKPGRGVGEFDWVHAVVVDTQGGVIGAGTYDQQLQKFVPEGGRSTAQQP
jgi:hypothetical protein